MMGEIGASRQQVRQLANRMDRMSMVVRRHRSDVWSTTTRNETIQTSTVWKSDNARGNGIDARILHNMS